MSSTPKDSSGKDKHNQKLLDSRRDFFKKSMLGAGGLALATGSTISGCAPQSEQTIDPIIGTNLDQEHEILKGVDVVEWYSPPEINLTQELEPIQDEQTLGALSDEERVQQKGEIDKGVNELPYFQSLRIDPKVKFNGFPHFLTVDDNGGNSTPSGVVTPLYAYNGVVPGPTFRVKGDQDLEVFLINNLGGNNDYWAARRDARHVKDSSRTDPDKKDYQLGEHLYGPHQQRVTNLHTHGLHVSPGQFKSSSGETSKLVHSDNVLLRVIPVNDYIQRVVKGEGPELKANEVPAIARYKFHLPRPDGTPHYEGTHWYHPHPHGATFDQVAGGMAGFLIVEGPIDQFLRSLYEKQKYTELPLMIQRVMGPKPNRAKGEELKNDETQARINGQLLSAGVPTTKVVRNQVIRLRILNGSVDGKGYVRLLIAKAKVGGKDHQPGLIDPLAKMYINGRCGDPINASSSAKRWFIEEPDTPNRLCLNQIAYDGIHLIDKDGNYTDLACEWLTIGVANRADVLIHIPEDATPGEEYIIWAQEMNEALDADGDTPTADNLALAKMIVQSINALPAPELNADKTSLKIDWSGQGKIQDLLLPVSTEEITIKDNSETTDAFLPENPTNLAGESISMKASGNAGTAIRTRRVLYSGFGRSSVNTVAFNPLVNITFGDGSNRDQRTIFNSMIIDGKKYGADTPHGEGWDTAQHRMLKDTAEEWSIYNYSMTVYMKDKGKDNEDPDNYIAGIPSYKKKDPSSRLSQLGPNASLRTKAVHHPFHIHQNAFWVRSIQDYEGNELLPLDDSGNPIPRWQDTVYIPHNGGRVIFRSRFMDYEGKFVNHCHLLQHEDWGMMQAIEVVNNTANAPRPNYIPVPVDATEKNNIFPALSLEQMFKLNLGKVKETITEGSAKMLCFDPGTTSFFDQTPVNDPVATASVEPRYFNTPTDPEEKKKQAEYVQQVNLKNVGKTIIPVPPQTSPFPQWNNRFVSSTQIV